MTLNYTNLTKRGFLFYDSFFDNFSWVTCNNSPCLHIFCDDSTCCYYSSLPDSNPHSNESLCSHPCLVFNLDGSCDKMIGWICDVMACSAEECSL